MERPDTVPGLVALMIIYQNLSTAAWICLALLGSYGFLWLLNDRIFPDRQWEQRASAGYAAFVFCARIVLVGTLAIDQYASESRSRLDERGCCAEHAWRDAAFFGSDAEKVFTLKYDPVLITEGFLPGAAIPTTWENC